MSARILLVEDNAPNRYLATFLLQKGGFQVTHAANGREALEEARREKPDLILMDIQMPEMDGYEAAAQFHADPNLCGIPLVAVTSYAMVVDRQKALRLGFVGYIEKPITTKTFIAEISQYLPGKTPSP